MSSVTNITNMETPKPYPEPEEETTKGGWEHLKDFGRTALTRLFADDGWADLPRKDEWVLCDPVEDGYRKVSGVGIPQRTDGTRPRAV